MKLRPEYGYSLANITAQSRDADTFGDDGVSEMLADDRMELIVPEPTKDDRKQYSLGRGKDWDDGRQGACEYRDSFIPMMNSLWPVELAYGRGENYAADLMNTLAGATSLVRIGDDFYIAMTGGGFDISWHIAAAYVCCGSVPPTYILENLKRSPFYVSDRMTREILYAARHGVKHLQQRTKQLAADIRSTGVEIAAKAKAKKSK